MTQQPRLVDNMNFKRPHVVLLGAGASRAAFPHGDRNGRKVPLGIDLVETLHLEPILREIGVEHRGRDFEQVYSELVRRHDKKRVEFVENKVRAYFEALEIDDFPNLYDHLVLSLRPQDMIATFNWDPFLFKALQRNHRKAPMPVAVFLHGSVAFGICYQDNWIGPRESVCRYCRKSLHVSKVLYPADKDYSSDPVIRDQWDGVRHFLKQGAALTIFGYRAPETDREAKRLLKGAWGTPAEKNIEQIELVDIAPEDDLRENWSEFIHTHHYKVFRSFYDCTIAQFPRRSCEAHWDAHMEHGYHDWIAFPRGVDWDALYDWFQPLIDAEKRDGDTDSA